MSVQHFTLEVLELYRSSQIKEVLECILHSILFSRAFGIIRPRETTVDFMQFYYVRCDDPIIEKYVEDRVELFYDAWQKKKFDPSKGILFLSFDEKRVKPQLFGLSKVEERFRWEQWIIQVRLLEHHTQPLHSPQLNEEVEDNEDRREKLEYDLRKTLLQILKLINENKNHIPPLTSKETTPFPYEITFPALDPSGQGIFAAIGNLLKAPSSAPLLT